jgi:membrane protease YdiL (CAAX protease family)
MDNQMDKSHEIPQADKKAITKDIQKTANMVALILIIFSFVSDIFIQGMVFIYDRYGLYEEEFWFNLYYIIGYFFQYVIIVPICLLIGNFRKPHKTKTYFRKPQVGFRQMLLYMCMTYALGTAVNFVTTLIYMVSYNFGHQNTDVNQILTDQLAYSPIMTIIVLISSVVLAPIFEELLFRGTVHTQVQKYGAAFAIVTTAVLFGLIHGNFHQAPYAVAFGLCLGYIVYKTKSIIPAIVTHFFINGFSMITLNVLARMDMTKLEEAVGSQDAGEIIKFLGDNAVDFSLYLVCVIAAVVMFTVGMVMFILKLRDDKGYFAVPKGDVGISEKRKYFVYFTSPIMVLLIVYLVYRGVMFELA